MNFWHMDVWLKKDSGWDHAAAAKKKLFKAFTHLNRCDYEEKVLILSMCNKNDNHMVSSKIKTVRWTGFHKPDYEELYDNFVL